MTATTRLISVDDAGRLAELQASGREFFEPWEPARPEAYFTPRGQLTEIEAALGRHDRGEALPHVIVNENGLLVGRITFSGITRGAFQSCSVGYWVSPEHNGRGYAGDALEHMLEIAFGELALHRVQAETLLHNVRSQRVLERAGFTRFGLAPRYLKIAGQWQDHILFQLLSPRHH